MREISVRNSGTGRLMTGPDGAAYFIPADSQAVRPALGYAICGPVGSAIPAGIPIPEAASVRNDLHAKLGNLPQMPVYAC
jgi:hypothetical protein